MAARLETQGWKTASGAPVKNLDLVRDIDREIAERKGPVRFRWVRGHVGNHFNEVADKLAGEAAREAAARPGPIEVPKVAPAAVEPRMPRPPRMPK